jgi:hypothetical protein
MCVSIGVSVFLHSVSAFLPSCMSVSTFVPALLSLYMHKLMAVVCPRDMPPTLAC